MDIRPDTRQTEAGVLKRVAARHLRSRTHSCVLEVVTDNHLLRSERWTTGLSVKDDPLDSVQPEHPAAAALARRFAGSILHCRWPFLHCRHPSGPGSHLIFFFLQVTHATDSLLRRILLWVRLSGSWNMCVGIEYPPLYMWQEPRPGMYAIPSYDEAAWYTYVAGASSDVPKKPGGSSYGDVG